MWLKRVPKGGSRKRGIKGFGFRVPNYIDGVHTLEATRVLKVGKGKPFIPHGIAYIELHNVETKLYRIYFYEIKK
jgi:hypothetical protein